MTDKMRSEFEAAVKARYADDEEYTLEQKLEWSDIAGGYWLDSTAYQFQGYQLARQSTDDQDEAWIAEHADRAKRRPTEQLVIDADDVREYLRGRKP